MCEYCGKRACPNGCPNCYTPRVAGRGASDAARAVGFTAVSEYGLIYKRWNERQRDSRKICKNNNEIITK